MRRRGIDLGWRLLASLLAASLLWLGCPEDDDDGGDDDGGDDDGGDDDTGDDDGGDDDTGDDDTCDHFVVPPPDQPTHGMTWQEWEAAWFQWVLSIPAETTPLLGGDCAQGQGGNVWFLAGTWNPKGEVRDCTIPGKTALFFPVLNYWTAACPEVWGKKDCFLVTNKEVEGAVEDFPWGKKAILEVELDACAAEDIEDYLYVTSFDVTYPKNEESVLYDPKYKIDCAHPWAKGNECNVPAGTTKVMGTAGYFQMIEPLPPGEYTLRIHGEIPGTFITDVTYNLTVE